MVIVNRQCGPSRPCAFEPSFSSLYSRVLVCDFGKLLRGISHCKRLRREVVRGVPYPGGVGGPTACPAPYRSCSCLTSVFSKYTRNLETGIFRKNVGDFLGTFGGPPRSSPRWRLGFAEGKAWRTSVFVRIRAPEGQEGSQKITK